MNAPDLLPAIDPTDVLDALRDGAVLLDVREYQEWMAGRIDGATHIPMNDLPARVGELSHDRRIVCICRSGNRSGQVTAWLRQQGYDALNMTGGMRSWESHGLPFVNMNGNPGAVI